MPVTFYPAIIDRSADGFGVSFPDFPGCIAAGTTVNEAAVNAELALGFHVDTMLKDGDKLPEVSGLDDVQAEEGDVARILVRVEAPAKVARVLISIDENLLRSIDAVATNRSAFLADAARAALRDNRPAVIDAQAKYARDVMAALASGRIGFDANDPVIRAATGQIGRVGDILAEVASGKIGGARRKKPTGF